MNLLDSIMHKLGYKAPHWTDEMKDDLYVHYCLSRDVKNKVQWLDSAGCIVTLSVKKIKK